MKKLNKIFAFVAVLICMAVFLVSCDGILVYTDGKQASSSGGKSADSGTSQTLQYETDATNYTIKVSQSELKAQDLETVIARVRLSVVEIYSTLSNGLASGSGVIISLNDDDEDGYQKALIVTCHHVIEKATAINVRTVYGDEFEAKLIASDRSSDIGLISITETDSLKFFDIEAAEFVDTSELKIGRSVIAIGNPLGVLGGTVTQGIVSAIDRNVSVEGRKMTLLQTDAAINGGNSGGGLFDSATGELIGIVNAGVESATAQGLSFAIPSNKVVNVIAQLLENGYVAGEYYFGAEFSVGYNRTVTSRSGPFAYYTTTYYVYIEEIDETGTFYKSGLRKGDIILSIKIADGEELTLAGTSDYNVAARNLTKLQDYLDGTYKVGDQVVVKYGQLSGGEVVEKTLSFEILQYGK